MKTASPESTEKLYTWSDMQEHEQAFILGAYTALLNTRKLDTLRRIFDLGNPQIVIGASGDGKPYCRIDGENSVKVMTLLIKTYL